MQTCPDPSNEIYLAYKAAQNLLIAHGADVDRAKALHFASSCNDIKKARFLVEEADANVYEPGVPEKDFYWE